MATSRTATQLVKDALLLLNVVSAAETPTSDDAAQVLATMQDIIAEWAAAGIIVPSVTTEYLSTVVAQEEYTVGENGSPSKNTVAPIRVEGAWIRVSDVDDEVQIIGEREYRALQNKTTSGQPDRMWVNYSAPNVVFSLYPSPDAIYTLYFVSVKPFTEPTGLTTNLLNTCLIPRHYYTALKWALACEMATYFEKIPNAWMLQRALVSKRQIESLNLANRMAPARLEIGGTMTTGTILNPPA